GELPTAPGTIALIILVISILIKEVLFYYKLYLGKKHQSVALISEAWHHRSDSLSSLAALAGVGLAILGEKFHLSILLYGDVLAGIIVSVIVMKVGFDLIKSSATIIVEKVLDDDKVEPDVETVEATKGVLKVDELLARTHGRY